MKKLFLTLAVLAGVLAFTRVEQAHAVTGEIYTSKNIALTITITPTPLIGFAPKGNTVAALANAQRQLAHPSFSNTVAYDPFAMQDVIAQATPPQSSVKVNFTVKADPTSEYLHVVPVTPTLSAGYGANTWSCVYQVYAYYPTYAYYVTDYGNGTTTSGTGPFPVYNYPTASLLQWEAETITTSFTAFSNSGTPGQTAFSGTKGEKQTVCFDLSLNIPTTVAPGTYTATIQYNLYVEL